MLLHSWGEFNKVTNRALQVQWVSSFIGVINAASVYEYHRIATKAYSYVGMDEATAKMCQSAMLAQYTRVYTQWYTQRGAYRTSRRVECVASVSCDHDSAGLWNVNIQVNEDQLQYYPGYLPDPAASGLFDLSLDYDESTPAGACVHLAYADLSTSRVLSLHYAASVPDFTTADIHAEGSTDGGVTWTEATPYSVTADVITLVTWTPGLYRLRYGAAAAGIVSNALATPAVPYEDTLSLATPYYWYYPATQEGRWSVQFFQDFANFNAALLVTEYRATADGAWTDISAACVVQSDRIITPYTEKATAGQFRATYKGVTSDPVSIPYDPAADKGDGSIVVRGVAVNSGTVWTANLMPQTIADFDAANLSASVSADGMTWTAATLADPYSSGDGSCDVNVDVGASALRYVKFYYNGVQSTDAFALPYKADGATLWHEGLGFIYSSATGAKYLARYGQSISGFDISALGLQVSTDGGATWAAVAGGVTSAGIFSPTDAITDLTPRLFKFTYTGGVESSPLAYPLA